MGIDFGVVSRVTLSDGRSVERRSADYREREGALQRRISACKRGSNNQRKLRRQLARMMHRESVRNHNECHRITTGLVNDFGTIVVEDLRIDNMTRSASGTVEEPGVNVAAKSGLNRSILEHTWGKCNLMLEYKAGWYGRTYVKVNPAYTSQTCMRCGAVDPKSRSGKVFKCTGCGATADADHNASVNVLNRYLAAGGASPPPGNWKKDSLAYAS